MTESTVDFVHQLGSAASALPPRYHGSLRFDVACDSRTEHWGLIFDHGRVEVFRDDRVTDCVVRTNRDMFDRMLSGRGGLYAALLRNQVSVEGDLTLLTPLRMLLPGPPGAGHPVRRRLTGTSEDHGESA